MLGEWHFSRGFGINRLLKKYGPDYFFANVSAYFNSAGIVIGNLECNFGSAGLARKHPMMADKRFIPAVKNAGFNILSAANNHLLDFGEKRAERTVKLIKDTGISVIGLSENPGVTLDMEGASIDIIGADILPLHHERPVYKNAGVIISGRIETICSGIINKVNDSSADYKIVCLHWGEEFIDYPDNQQVYWARKIIDSGADAVIGSHPHVPQGIEQYQHGVIAYSLGNFISDMGYPRTKIGAILEINLGIEDKQIEFSVVPLAISDDFRPVLIKNMTISELFRNLNEKVSKIAVEGDPPELDSEYTVAARQAEVTMWEWTKEFYKKNFWKYPLSAQLGWFREKIGIK